jgi:hypothetical protein
LDWRDRFRRPEKGPPPTDPSAMPRPPASVDRFGPDTPHIERLVRWLGSLNDVDIVRLAMVYQALSGENPETSPHIVKLVGLIRQQMVHMPAADATRADHPFTQAMRAGADAVLAAIARADGEPSPPIRRAATSGGAELCVMLYMRPPLEPEFFSIIWDGYAYVFPKLGEFSRRSPEQ